MPKRRAMPAAEYDRLRVIRKDDSGSGGGSVAGNPAMSGGSNPPTSPNGNATPPLSTTKPDGSTSPSHAGGYGGGGGLLAPAIFVGRSGIASSMGGKPKHTVVMEPKGKKRRRRKPRLGIRADDIASRSTQPIAHPGTRTKALGGAPGITTPAAPAPAPTGFDSMGQPAGEDTELAVGFRLSADMALGLALRNGIPPQALFLELCEIGEAGEWDAETAARVQTVIEMVAADEPPLTVTISGVGRLMANEETGGKDLIYATVDSPELDELREDVMDALEEAGVLPLEEHSFIPMIPLAYVDPNVPAPALANIATKTFPLAAISVQLGAAFVDYPLSGSEDLDDGGTGANGVAGNFGDIVAATRALPLVSNKSAGSADADVRKAVWCPIVKTDSDRRLVCGIVLQPEVVDAQGDIISEDVIEAAAHQFLADYNAGTTLGHMHKNFDRKLELVESYIAPADMPISGSIVKKGTWLITSRVVDDATWEQVKKGEIQGFSIGGVAKARPLTDQI